MSDTHHEYRPFASGFGIFIGVLILWAGSYGLFALGRWIVGELSGGPGDAGGG